MFGPDLGGVGAGRLIAVAHALHAGRGIDAEVAVGVDHPGGHIATAGVDDAETLGHGSRGVADRRDAAVGDDDHAVVELRAGPRQDCATDDGHVLARHRRIGGGEGIGIGGRVKTGGQGPAIAGTGRAGARLGIRGSGGGAGPQQQPARQNAGEDGE